MTDSHSNLDLLIQLDEICEEFESVFVEGKSPRIEDYLDRVQDEHRAALIHELVKLEVAILTDQGQSVSADDMFDRYGELLPPAGAEDTRAVH